MPPWLTTLTPEIEAELPTLATRLVLAWICGWVVAVLARRKQPAGTTDTLTLTLVLMSILIAMATQIIGDNIARAFSLVGALSIVRFRTAVPATRDVAFVLAAVVVGMAIGSGQYSVSALGLLIVGLATQFNAPSNVPDKTQLAMETTAIENVWRLTIVVGLQNAGDWEAELARLTTSYQLVSAETARRGGALELVYRCQPRAEVDASKMVASLNAIQSVESAAAKQLT